MAPASTALPKISEADALTGPAATGASAYTIDPSNSSLIVTLTIPATVGVNDRLCAPVSGSMTASAPRQSIVSSPDDASICDAVRSPQAPAPPARSEPMKRTLPATSFTDTVNQEGTPAVKSVRASNASRDGRVLAVCAAPGTTVRPDPGV